ncbi:unnamed protein product, partial [Ectocarpus fasciculatus]
LGGGLQPAAHPPERGRAGGQAVLHQGGGHAERGRGRQHIWRREQRRPRRPRRRRHRRRRHDRERHARLRRRRRANGSLGPN